ncbi:DUF2231 domain-containing protein [Paenibacillus alginolyticus]|uniref:DUF2231 domain-containing protein n=1 Tax=Paenibacillus alginolyticus TaxID=59839 RepID=UPI0035E466B0
MDYILKNLHYIVTHVPIALLVFSFIFDLIAMIAKKREWHSAGMLCLVVGAPRGYRKCPNRPIPMA